MEQQTLTNSAAIHGLCTMTLHCSLRLAPTMINHLTSNTLIRLKENLQTCANFLQYTMNTVVYTIYSNVVWVWTMYSVKMTTFIMCGRVQGRSLNNEGQKTCYHGNGY